MSVIGGIYTPDIEVIAIDTDITGDPTTVIRTPFADGGINGPVCLIVGDVTSLSGNGTLMVESGTWDGAVFEADADNAEVCFVSAPENFTSTESILKVSNGKYYPGTAKVGAFQITVTGTETKAHVRVQGKTVTVP
jgi:hypothetical protein